MKIKEIHNIDDCGQGSVSIYLNNERCLCIRAAESEDCSFYRDLNDALFIVELVKKAYEAGRAGEELEVEFINESEGDE